MYGINERLDISCISVSPIQTHESHICHPPIARLPAPDEPIRATRSVLSIGSHQWLRPFFLSANPENVQIRKRTAPTRPAMRDRLLRTSSLCYETSHWSGQQERGRPSVSEDLLTCDGNRSLCAGEMAGDVLYHVYSV